MTWKCPACETDIRHGGETPHPYEVYRCHICRLELIIDRDGQKLTLASLPRPSIPKPRRS